MTVTYGFYDSVSSDRVYNAEQMGRMFDGVLQDGIFAFEGGALEVVEYSGMTVQVEAGRAWFNHTWTLNDANLNVVVPTAHATLNRIDIVYLETNKNSAVRANKIDILEGTPASSPVPPTLATGPEQYQYALAHIYVGAGVTSIYTANITDKRGVDTDYAVSGLYSYIEPLSVDTEHLATAAVTTAKVANNQITNPLLRDSAALSVIGRASNSVGDPADIVAGTDGYVLRRSGTTVGFGTVGSAGLSTGAVTAGKVATGGISATEQLANDIVDNTKLGNKTIQILERLGGATTHWDTPGDTDYAIGMVKMCVGSTGTIMASGTDFKTVYCDFPFSFTTNPIVIGMCRNIYDYTTVDLNVQMYNPGTDGCFFAITATTGNVPADVDVEVLWMAIGVE